MRPGVRRRSGSSRWWRETKASNHDMARSPGAWDVRGLVALGPWRVLRTEFEDAKDWPKPTPGAQPIPLIPAC